MAIGVDENSTDATSAPATEMTFKTPVEATPDCPSDDDVSNAKTEKAQMKSEFFRIRSYRVKGWPAKKKIHPADLARTGLYYTGNGDTVTCVFCGVSISKWKKGDNPVDVHRELSPTCPFLAGENVGNIPLSLPQSSENVHVRSTRVRFPDLSMYEARLATFDNWPSDAQQKPEDLAMAGFFYMGSLDRVKCFCCEQKLMKWLRSDDPWVEHIKFSPRCQFVLMIKGREFVEEIHRAFTRRPHHERSHQQPLFTEHRHRQPLPTEPSRVTLNNISMDEKLFNTMNEPSVRKVLEMGYPFDAVKILVQRFLAYKEREVPTTEYLLTLLLAMEDRGYTCENIPLDTRMLTQTVAARPETNTASPNHSPSHVGVADKSICKICLIAEVQLTFQPCGHLVCCVPCGSKLQVCPVCRQRVQSSVRTYLT